MNLNVALAGNPNCGKTSLFNALSGSRYKVGNYPGVTVERKDAKIKHFDKEITLTDLPGIYSLSAESVEEIVARNFLFDERPDVVVDVVDASNLRRNLYLFVQLLELEVPSVIALNMIDVAEETGMVIDVEKMERALGVKVVQTVARDGQGRHELLNTISRDYAKCDYPVISYGEDIDIALTEMIKVIQENNFLTDKYPAKWTALKYLEKDEHILEEGRSKGEVHGALLFKSDAVNTHLNANHNTDTISMISDYRYGFVNAVVKKCMTKKQNAHDKYHMSDKIDAVLTNRVAGPVVMMGILYLIYQFSFWASEYPVGWLETFFGFLSAQADAMLPEGLLKSLIISGVIDGAGGVLGFTPLIFFMFIAISILEDTGYMTRIAFMLDRVFRYFNLHGNSVIPFVVSGGIAGGCAVPGVMAARSIKGTKERLLSILVAPFMVCGAKIPVYALIVAIFFPFNKGLAMLAITFLSWVMALVVAKILANTVVRGENTAFIMELPPYRVPTVKGTLLNAWDKTKMYIKKAGTYIIAVSIVLWALMTFPGLDEQQAANFEQARQTAISAYDNTIVTEAMSEKEEVSDSAVKLRDQLAAVDSSEAGAALKNSYAGKIGTAIESVTKYAGFDWKINIALLGGFAAKEVVVSTLGTAYSLGEIDAEDSGGSLMESLKSDPNWSIALGLALIVFTMIYAPCFVATVVVGKEAGSWKWAAFTVVAYTAVAYVLAVVVYQLFK